MTAAKHTPEQDAIDTLIERDQNMRTRIHFLEMRNADTLASNAALREALRGICIAIIDRARDCSECFGTGKDQKNPMDACRICGGIGETAECGDVIAAARAALAGGAK